MRFLKFTATLLIFAALFAGCKSGEPPNLAKSSSAAAEQSSSKEVYTSSEPDEAFIAAVERASETYRADAVFYDAVTPIKALLVGDGQIVAFTYMSGFEQTEIIDRAAVARTQITALDALSLVNIYDKTGKTLSATLLPDDAQALADMLND